eukprot:8176-Heterococcus_DN1.PRE.1
MLAIESGNVELVAYLRERGHTAPLHHGMMSAAAQRGHLAMCAYLRESGCTWGFDAFSACARHREGAGFAWLLEHGCCGTAKQLYTAAVYNDDATVFDWLCAQGIATPSLQELSSMLCGAGFTGNLGAADWLIQQGAAWPAALNLCGSQSALWRVGIGVYAYVSGTAVHNRMRAMELQFGQCDDKADALSKESRED